MHQSRGVDLIVELAGGNALGAECVELDCTKIALRFFPSPWQTSTAALLISSAVITVVNQHAVHLDCPYPFASAEAPIGTPRWQ